MVLPRIYESCVIAINEKITLGESASHHLSHVLRMAMGDSLIIFNGSGGEYLAQIDAIHKKAVTVLIKNYNKENRESFLKIHLVQAITRSEKMDFVLQKAVELGVSEFTPIFTERVNIKLPNDRLQKRIQHWQGVIISACEQSGRTIIPTLNKPLHYQDWLKTTTIDRGFILHPFAKEKLGNLSIEKEVVTVIIGPEGGLSDAEISLAEEKGLHRLNLGPRILRTETAPLAAITALQCFYGDMG
ncbi:MAG: Ribosomal RNA small subunit methyltransferase E [Legionellaceae bacterium]